jgi:acyl-CoA thioesterase FadM
VDWAVRKAAAYRRTMLRTTHTSTVTEEQIDHLGHMNVRFYAVNAYAGTRALLATVPGWGGPHEVHDIYTRHHREQLLGTPLVVRSAVLGAGPAGMRIHHELAAADSGVLAATFVHVVSPLGEDGERSPLPDELIALAEAEAIALPDYAATRTIDLDADPAASAPTLAVARERGLELRKERLVPAEECDERGRYRVELAPLLSWGGEPISGSTDGTVEELLHTTADGAVMGWASMETHTVVTRLPRQGDRIQSFAAGVGIGDKVIHRVNWAFDLDAEELLMAFESVSMAFDTKARRPLTIPEGYRARILAHLQSDLAPTARP